ncbi:MAG: hypothetical protein J0L99_11000 [Chitinophagales bacterium]|nr:hypothetical protein [Chitinophagales bacterium]
MLRFFKLLFIGATLIVMPSCKKTDQFEFILTEFWYNTSSPSNCWVIFHESSGKVLDVQRFYPTSAVHDYHFSTDALGASGTCYLTIAQHRLDDGFLALLTIPNIASGQHALVQYLNVSSDHRNTFRVYGDLIIQNTPEIDDFSYGSLDKASFFTTPPNLKVSLSAFSGGSGIVLALKVKNETDPRFYWLPDTGSNNFFTDTLDFNDFVQDWPTSDFSFPFKSRWSYEVIGVTKEGNNPVFGYLGSKERDNSDPLTNHFSIRRPAQVPFTSLWVSALDSENGKYYENSVSVGNNYTFPDIPFRVKNLNFQNSAYVTCSTEGDFDALQIDLFGDNGKTYWRVEGPADELKAIIMPKVPDSLVQQWPKLNAFGVGHTICGDIDGIDGFEELSHLDPKVVLASTHWRAKYGYRAQWKIWP